MGPGADLDGDGVADDRDRCPEHAGVAPHGCPPLDGDGDRVRDGDDACPEQVGPPANKGCPDKDSDDDTIIDRLDRCPMIMGPVDLNGCPPDDGDDDGIPNADDRCPDRREVWNGRRDGDGCPDKGRALVEVREGTIALARYPRVVGSKLAAADRAMIETAGRLLRSIRAGAVQVVVVAEYGLSYGDSIERARNRAIVVGTALGRAAGLPAGAVRVAAGAPDGKPRIEITFR